MHHWESLRKDGCEASKHITSTYVRKEEVQLNDYLWVAHIKSVGACGNFHHYLALGLREKWFSQSILHEIRELRLL